MKGIAKIALSVALIVIVVLSIVVASVAWFTSNPEVTASDVTLNASQTLTVSFDTGISRTDDKYNGQIGNVATGDDAPFVCEAGSFNVNVNSLSPESSGAKIKVEFGTVEIRTKAYGNERIGNVLITDLFSIAANVYKQNATGGYVKDSTSSKFRAYNSETDGALTRYQKVLDAVIRDDGVLMNGNNVASFPEGAYALSFTYVFLPDEAYAVWEEACNGDPSRFEDIHSYERYAGGDYIGVMEYTAYKAKYHYGLQRYKIENGHYVPDENGGFVRIVTGYANENITKYAVTYVPDANGTHYKLEDNNFVKKESATEAEKANGILCNITPASGSGGYILVGEDYMQYLSYRQRNGFPYSDDKYMGETFTFTVSCSLEE